MISFVIIILLYTLFINLILLYCLFQVFKPNILATIIYL